MKSRNTSKSSSTTRKNQSSRQETRKDILVIDRLGAQSRIVTRRLCGPPSVLSTNAGGLLTVATLMGTTGASGAADFAQLAGLFTAYRVRMMRTQLRPFNPVPYFNGVNVVVVPASIAAGFYQGGLGGATYQSLSDSAKPRFLSGYEKHDLTINYEGDNDAHLWTPTTSAIAATEAFGVIVCGQATAASVNTPVWHYSVEYVIEFKAPY